MDFEKFKARLYEFDALRESDEIRDGIFPRIEPKYAEHWPSEIDNRLHITLRKAGFRRPYLHQSEAIIESLQGNDVVLESPTASGKTLSFAVPMLDVLLRNPGSHALMIYPMKALAYDQRSQLSTLCKPLGLRIATYDGDTSKPRRKELRANLPHILISNPEILNNSLLAHRDTIWTRFLKNLKIIVVDEMHEYRGLFGTNMALSLRRFFLHLNRIGATPRLFLSTATCANPGEHAANLTGRDVVKVEATDSMRPLRHLAFVNLNVPDFQFWQIFQLRVINAALTALAENLQVLIFCPSKQFIGRTLINCQEIAKKRGFDEKRIFEFSADLLSNKRRNVLERLKSGDFRVIFTTNALELGLDIGGLDGVILAGFPPNTMSAWQQIGRAGRGWDKDAFVLFYALNDPIDQYFVKDIDAFRNRPLDHLVADPNNKQIIENHMLSLKEETGGILNESDEAILGKTFYEEAKHSKKKPIIGIKKGQYQYHLSKILRGGIGQTFQLYDIKDMNDPIGKVGDLRRFRELYIGAIFSFMGNKYRVKGHQEQAIVLEEAEQYLRSDPHFLSDIYPDVPTDGIEYVNEWQVYYGTLTLNINPTGYKVVDERGGGEGRTVSRGGPWDSFNRKDLHTVWFNIPMTDENAEGIGALEHLLRVGAMFVIPADRYDASTWSKLGDGLRIFYYENYEGGIGLARKLFEIWPKALDKGIAIAEKCTCEKSCQRCIEPAKSWNLSDAEIDKRAGITLARKLLAARDSGVSGRVGKGAMNPEE